MDFGKAPGVEQSVVPTAETGRIAARVKSIGHFPFIIFHFLFGSAQAYYSRRDARDEMEMENGK